MKLHFREPENVKHCISTGGTDGCSRIPLFHGTRMYALQVNEKDRERFYAACDRVISFAKKLIWDCPVDDVILEEYISTGNPHFLGDVVSQYKTAAFDYGSLYVTTGYTEAIKFANHCGGELGQWAYEQCVAFRDLQIDLDDETRDAAMIVLEEYIKYETSEKVILVFSDVRFEDLQTERGKPFLIFDENGDPNETYNTRQIDALHKAKVTDRSEHVLSFRLQKCETYMAHLIRQNNFKSGISVFTDIRDVDKYLKWNDSKCLRELL